MVITMEENGNPSAGHQPSYFAGRLEEEADGSINIETKIVNNGLPK
ncbi:hypothetical protein [Labilibaculum antarcticum]|nr:hypothetical protein [Labilibaculum antarcticum]